MNSKIENITPEIAAKYLEKNIHNRPIKPSAIRRYALQMKAKQWLISHQGIAFDTEGNLFDGQNRLLAIKEAGVSAPIYVTRDCPVALQNGVIIKTQDVVDIGVKRGVPDQLFLSHDIPNACFVAASCSIIAQIFFGQMAGTGLTTTQIKYIYDIYGKHVQKLLPIARTFKPTRNSVFVGTLSLARHAYKDESDIFTESVAVGDGLKRGDPALTLRNKFIEGVHYKGDSGSSGRLYFAGLVAGAFMAFLEKRSLTKLYSSTEALEILKKGQKANAAKIAASLGFAL